MLLAAFYADHQGLSEVQVFGQEGFTRVMTSARNNCSELAVQIEDFRPELGDELFNFFFVDVDRGAYVSVENRGLCLTKTACGQANNRHSAVCFGLVPQGEMLAAKAPALARHRRLRDLTLKLAHLLQRSPRQWPPRLNTNSSFRPSGSAKKTA